MLNDPNLDSFWNIFLEMQEINCPNNLFESQQS